MLINDSFRLIRVGGRLQTSYQKFDAQHPITLPEHHPLTSSLIIHFHQKLLHAVPRVLLATIRQLYWPTGDRKLVSSTISKCLQCFRMKPVLSQHVMGSLPANRVRPNKAFQITGVEVKNRPPVKCYILILTRWHF